MNQHANFFFKFCHQLFLRFDGKSADGDQSVSSVEQYAAMQYLDSKKQSRVFRAKVKRKILLKLKLIDGNGEFYDEKICEFFKKMFVSENFNNEAICRYFFALARYPQTNTKDFILHSNLNLFLNYRNRKVFGNYLLDPSTSPDILFDLRSWHFRDSVKFLITSLIEAIDSVQDLNRARKILFSRQNGESIFCELRARSFFFRYLPEFSKIKEINKIEILKELLVFEIQARDYRPQWISYQTNFFLWIFRYFSNKDSFQVILDCIEFIKIAFKDDHEAMENLLLSQDEFGNSCLHNLSPQYHEQLHKFKDTLQDFPDILEKLFALRNLNGKLYSE
jgi:hypothetical protein